LKVEIDIDIDFDIDIDMVGWQIQSVGWLIPATGPIPSIGFLLVNIKPPIAGICDKYSR